MTYASIRTARKSKHWKTRQANARHAVKLSLSIFTLLCSIASLARSVTRNGLSPSYTSPNRELCLFIRRAPVAQKAIQAVCDPDR
jgi:hypothetical protein